MKKRLFGLVDCNNFFVSCERVFNHQLVGKPVVVLSSNDGCVIARSAEAKLLGIPMGAPAFKYRDLFRSNEVLVLSSNFGLYADLSQRVMAILETAPCDVEQYSIDEAFLRFNAESEATAVETARTLSKQIWQWTGIPVSIGIAPTKTLAKVATEYAKKDLTLNGVCMLTEQSAITTALENLPVGDVWGIGWRTAKLLTQKGIFTALQLTHTDDRWIQRKLKITGLKTVWELRGISCIDLVMEERVPQSIIRSRSFGMPISDVGHLKEAIASHIAHACTKLRAHNLGATTLSVFIKTNRHSSSETYYSGIGTIHLPVAAHETDYLVSKAFDVFATIYKYGHWYKRAGVMMHGLRSYEHFQHSFLSDKGFTTAPLMDAQVGTVALNPLEQPWKTKQEKRSPNFTTSWDELPIASLK